MGMQINDFIEVSYSAKVKETGQEIDKAENAPMIVKEGYILKGLEEPLKQMNVGEKKTVEIAPQDAFGQKNFDLIKLVPLSEFRKHDTKPTPGMVIEADRTRGRVLSVSGGRVKVDFNHPLAGKTLVYDLEIKKKIDGNEEKIKSLFSMYTKADAGKLKISVNDKTLDMEIPLMINPIVKKRISDDVTELMGFDKVRYIEVYEKRKTE